MTFADKCKLLGKRQDRNVTPAGDNRLRAALLPKRALEQLKGKCAAVGLGDFAVASVRNCVNKELAPIGSRRCAKVIP